MQMLKRRLLNRSLPSVVAWLAAGGLFLGGLTVVRSSRAAPVPSIPSSPGPLVQPDPNAPGPTSAPQPLAVQALDAAHFVVVTREPRLVWRAGQEGRYVNMIVHVVTHYTVQNGRLTPIEHVRVPPGWRALAVGE
jgi:hypothetical protein